MDRETGCKLRSRGRRAQHRCPADREAQGPPRPGQPGPDPGAGKQLLALVQQAIVTAQSRDHALRRPDCRTCAAPCQVKDYRPHQIATLFGQVTLRLPRFRCAGCGGAEAGTTGRHIAARHLNSTRSGRSFPPACLTGSPLACSNTSLPIDAGSDPETLRATLKVGGPCRYRRDRAPGNAQPRRSP